MPGMAFQPPSEVVAEAEHSDLVAQNAGEASSTQHQLLCLLLPSGGDRGCVQPHNHACFLVMYQYDPAHAMHFRAQHRNLPVPGVTRRDVTHRASALLGPPLPVATGPPVHWPRVWDLFRWLSAHVLHWHATCVWLSRTRLCRIPMATMIQSPATMLQGVDHALTQQAWANTMQQQGRLFVGIDTDVGPGPCRLVDNFVWLFDTAA